MTIPDLIGRFTEFAAVVADLLVFGFAIVAYQATRKRSLLLIGIPCALWAIFAIGNVVLSDQPSWLRWGAYNLAMGASYILWVVGSGLLFRDYSRMLSSGQLAASPNGGPGTRVGNP